MKVNSFEDFFKELLQRKEFADAFNDISTSEKSGVKDVSRKMFDHFDIAERDLVPEYINKVCELVAREGSKGSICVMETALCNAGNYLPKKYSISAAA